MSFFATFVRKLQLNCRISHGFATNFLCRDTCAYQSCSVTRWNRVKVSRSKEGEREFCAICFLFDALARSPGAYWRPSSRAFCRLKETNRKSPCTLYATCIYNQANGTGLVLPRYVDILITSPVQTRTAGCTTTFSPWLAQIGPVCISSTVVTRVSTSVHTIVTCNKFGIRHLTSVTESLDTFSYMKLLKLPEISFAINVLMIFLQQKFNSFSYKITSV